MAYRALYREWRPRNFSQMVGQKPIIETLRNQVITDRIAHAYLFCGSRGTGKTSTAKILAKAINCENPQNGDPCGKCANCLRMENEETLDIIEIDAASNNGVNEIRDLRDTVKYPPQYGRYKVYIIDEVHMLSVSAFNALLKTLEEPPEHIVFILATTEPQKLPDTILSRCQRFDFGRISIPEIAGRLREAADGSGAEATDGALMLIARAAEGGMRDALSLLDMCLGYRNQVDEALVRSILGTSDNAFLFEFSDALADRDARKVFLLIDRIVRDGKDPAVFAKDVCRHIRALLIAKTCPEDMKQVMDITGEEADEYISHSGKLTLTRLMDILDNYMRIETEMRYTSTPRLALENTSLKSCLKTEMTDQQAVLDRIAELEQQVTELAQRPASAEPGPTPDSGPAEKAKEKQPAARREGKTPEKAGQQSTTPVPDAWKELMDRFRKTETSIWSLLTQGKIVSSKDGKYTWQAGQPGGKMFVIPLNMPEKKQKIIDCLSEITGAPCSFEATEASAGEAEKGSSDSDYLQQFYSAFGRESVSVVE